MHSIYNGSGFFWIQILFTLFKQVLYLIIPLLLLKEFKKKSYDNRIQSLSSFYIFYFSIVNFCQFIPVLGSRFWDIARVLSIFLWFKIIYQKNSAKSNKYIFLLLISSSFDFITKFRLYSLILEPDFLISNTISLIAKYWNVYSY